MMNISFEKINDSHLEFVNRVRNGYAETYLHDSRIFTLEETKYWFQTADPNFWMIILDNTVVGYFRLSNYSKKNKYIYIGADIAPEHTGKGIAKEAYKKFIPYVFNTYNVNKLSLEVLQTNERAINLYTKLGFVEEGIKREEFLKKGKWINSVVMSLLKSEYDTLNLYI
jgi:RimJ/RimL family protein N-acetyltransferase